MVEQNMVQNITNKKKINGRNQKEQIIDFQINEVECLNSNKIGIFEYINDGILRVYGTKENPWFSAKDVANILGYVNTRKSIRDHVDEEDSCLLENIGGNETFLPNSQAHSVLINESGLYSLIIRSKKQEAKPFKRWVTSEVLPSIRKSSTYNVPTVKNTKQIKIQETKSIIELYNLIDSSNGLDARDKLFFRDYAKNIFLDATSNLIEMKQENQEWSVSRRLQSVYGVNENKQIKKMSIAFGRILSKKYREIYNTNPIKRSQYVDGTVRDINNYVDNDWVLFGDDLLEEYFKDFLHFEEE